MPVFRVHSDYSNNKINKKEVFETRKSYLTAIRYTQKICGSVELDSPLKTDTDDFTEARSMSSTSTLAEAADGAVPRRADDVARD